MAQRTGNLLPCNAQAAKRAKPLRGRRTEYRIASCPGLVLDVRENGQGTYYAVYFIRIGRTRKFRRVKLGTRDVTPLAKARKRAWEISVQVEGGEDPAAQRDARRDAMTFRELCEQRLSNDETISASTRDYYGWCLRRYAFPAFGDVPASEVTPEHVVKVIDQIAVGRGALVTADRTRVAVASCYSWGTERRVVSNNPAKGLGSRSTSQPRARVLSADEIKGVWKALDQSTLSEPMQIILKLAMLTAQRGGEICGAQVSELVLDGPAPMWIIPGDTRVKGRRVRGRTKSGNEQRLPLSSQAAALFRRALQLADEDVTVVFPAAPGEPTLSEPDTTSPHIDRHSVSRAMARLRSRFGIEDCTPHDFRRTCATWLGEQGVRPDVIERLLNHTPRGVTRAVYDRSKLEPMVRHAMQAWADFVDGIVAGREPAQRKVIPGPWSA